MSGESIYMLDISEDPPWYPQRRIEAVEPGARAKETTIREIVSPINAETSEVGLLQRGRPYPPQNAQYVHAAARQAEVDRSVVGAKPQQQVTAIPE